MKNDTPKLNYVSQEEYAATVAAMNERIRKKAAQDTLRAEWRANGCRLTLAKKTDALRNA